MALGNFDPRTLSTAVRDLGDSRDLFLINNVFTRRNTHPTEAIQYGKLNAMARIVPYNRPQEPATPVNKLGGTLLTIVPPIIRPKKVFDYDFFSVLNPALASFNPYSNPNDQAAEKILLEQQDLRRRIDRVVEIQCAQALVTGQITITYNDGGTVTLDLGYTTGTGDTYTIQPTLTGTDAWTSAQAKPIQVIENLATIARRGSDYGGAFDVLMGINAWKNYLNVPAIQKLWVNIPANIQMGGLTLSERARYKGEMNGFRYYVIDEGYVNDSDVWTSVWDPDTIVMIPQDRETFSIEYGAIFEKPTVNADYARFIQTDFFSKIVTEKEDPPVTELIVQSNPLAVIRNVRAIRVLKTA